MLLHLISIKRKIIYIIQYMIYIMYVDIYAQTHIFIFFSTLHAITKYFLSHSYHYEKLNVL